MPNFTPLRGDLHQRGVAVEHADVPLREGGEGGGTVQPAGRDRTGQTLVDQVVLEPGEGVDVLRGVDAVRADGVGVATAAAQQPLHRLGLRLLRAERQRVRVRHALVLERRGVGGQLLPGLRRGEAGLPEEGLVVEEQARGGGERHPVLHALHLARGGQLGGEVGLGGDGEQVVGRVEQALVGVVGVRADLRHVGRLAGVDQLLDLAVDVVPGVDADLDLHTGVLALVLLHQPVPVLLGAVGGGVAVVRGDQLQGDVTRTAGEAAAAEDRRHAQCGHRRNRSCPTPLHCL